MADQSRIGPDGSIFYTREEDDTMYRLYSPGMAPPQQVEITGKELQALKNYINAESFKNSSAVGIKGQIGGTMGFTPPYPTKPMGGGSGGSGGTGGNSPSKANNTGATVPENSEKIDIRVSDTVTEELNRLNLEIINDSKDLIPFNLSFESIDFIPEREVFSADNETKYGIYFEDTETDQFIDVRNTQSEDNSLAIIRKKITDLNKARRNGTKRYFDAFSVKYDSSGTPEISLKIDIGNSGIDGLDVIILEIKDNIESFTRQIPPS